MGKRLIVQCQNMMMRGTGLLLILWIHGCVNVNASLRPSTKTRASSMSPKLMKAQLLLEQMNNYFRDMDQGYQKVYSNLNSISSSFESAVNSNSKNAGVDLESTSSYQSIDKKRSNGRTNSLEEELLVSPSYHSTDNQTIRNNSVGDSSDDIGSSYGSKRRYKYTLSNEDESTVLSDGGDIFNAEPFEDPVQRLLPNDSQSEEVQLYLDTLKAFEDPHLHSQDGENKEATADVIDDLKDVPTHSSTSPLNLFRKSDSYSDEETNESNMQNRKRHSSEDISEDGPKLNSDGNESVNVYADHETNQMEELKLDPARILSGDSVDEHPLNLEENVYSDEEINRMDDINLDSPRIWNYNSNYKPQMNVEESVTTDAYVDARTKIENEVELDYAGPLPDAVLIRDESPEQRESVRRLSTDAIKLAAHEYVEDTKYQEKDLSYDYSHISIPEDDDVQSIHASPSLIACNGREVYIGGYETLKPRLSNSHGGPRKGSYGEDTHCACTIL
eukprot:160666_1